MMALVSLERACAYRSPADGMGFYLFRSLRAILLYESRCFNIRNKKRKVSALCTALFWVGVGLAVPLLWEYAFTSTTIAGVVIAGMFLTGLGILNFVPVTDAIRRHVPGLPKPPERPDFRVRESAVSTRPPRPEEGEDGDIWYTLEPCKDEETATPAQCS